MKQNETLTLLAKCVHVTHVDARFVKVNVFLLGYNSHWTIPKLQSKSFQKRTESSKSGNCAQQQHAEITASQQHFGRNSSSSSPRCIIQSRSLCLTGGGNKLHREPDGMRGKVFPTRARLVSTHSPQEASF